ncbi:MAG: cyclic nucleotide-binding domain-containing protein [Myxococcota bacterium]
MTLEAFKDHPLVQGFSDSDLEALQGVLQPRDYLGDDTIFEEGVTTGGLALVSEGVVEVQKQTDHGRPHTIATLSAMTVLGEIEFLSGSRATATVRAKTAVSSQFLPRSEFVDWLDAGHPCAAKLTFNIGRVLARRLEETNLALIRLVKPEEVREFEAFRDKLVTEWNF